MTDMNKRKYAGADWVKRALGVKDMSLLGETVANLLGDCFAGIYHLEDSDLKKVDWSSSNFISFLLRGRDLATVDGSALTMLVVLSHDRMVRVSINPHSYRAIELMFHPRSSRSSDDACYKRLPTMEDHMAMIRKSLGANGEDTSGES
jgi:hypothetical protein